MFRQTLLRALRKNDDQFILLLAECFNKALSGQFGMQSWGKLFQEMIILMHWVIGIGWRANVG